MTWRTLVTQLRPADNEVLRAGESYDLTPANGQPVRVNMEAPESIPPGKEAPHVRFRANVETASLTAWTNFTLSQDGKPMSHSGCITRIEN